MLTVGEDDADNRRVLEVAAEQPAVVPCLGLHPDRFADHRLDEVLAQIEAHAERIVAVGEVGLDYWRALEEEGRAEQRRMLTALAAAARRHDLPLNVHSRSAGHHALALLEEIGAPRVHMHAFDGRAGYAVRAAERGVFFSLPPSILRSPQKQKLARLLPLDALLLESDAPVLGPDRDVRNEPANLSLTLDFLVQARGVPRDELIGLLADNTRRAYPRLAALRREHGAACSGLLAVVMLVLLVVLPSCGNAPQQGQPLGWQDLDPAARAYLAAHHEIEPDDPTRELDTLLESMRRSREYLAPSAGDPVALDLQRFVIEASESPEVSLVHLLRPVHGAGLAPLDPRGERSRLLRSLLARAGLDPEVATRNDLERELTRVREARASRRGQPAAWRPSYSFEIGATIRALLEGLPGPWRRALWVGPPLDLADGHLGPVGIVNVTEPWCLIASLDGLAPSLEVEGLDFLSAGARVLGQVHAGRTGGAWLRVFRFDGNSSLATLTCREETLRSLDAMQAMGADVTGPEAGESPWMLERCRERGLDFTSSQDEARILWWDVALPATCNARVRGVHGDLVSERFAASGRYDLAIWNGVADGWHPLLHEFALLNLRRVLRPGGVLVTSLRLRPEQAEELGWVLQRSRQIGGQPVHAYALSGPSR